MDPAQGLQQQVARRRASSSSSRGPAMNFVLAVVIFAARLHDHGPAGGARRWWAAWHRGRARRAGRPRGRRPDRARWTAQPVQYWDDVVRRGAGQRRRAARAHRRRRRRRRAQASSVTPARAEAQGHLRRRAEVWDIGAAPFLAADHRRRHRRAIPAAQAGLEAATSWSRSRASPSCPGTIWPRRSTSAPGQPTRLEVQRGTETLDDHGDARARSRIAGPTARRSRSAASGSVPRPAPPTCARIPWSRCGKASRRPRRSPS